VTTGALRHSGRSARVFGRKAVLQGLAVLAFAPPVAASGVAPPRHLATSPPRHIVTSPPWHLATSPRPRGGAGGGQEQKPRGQVPVLGRPTKPDDPAPVLDFFAYFNGSWTFTWDYPESPLGPAGVLEGSTRFAQLDDRFFEATTTGKTENGPVTIREVIGYLKDAHTLSRTVTDSRGFSYLQIGTVAGDLGGQFTIRFEGQPFVRNGRTIRVRSVMRLLSPLNYRTQTTISVDGGPYVNHGNPWFRKEGAGR
jgi:hypothetical protein